MTPGPARRYAARLAALPAAGAVVGAPAANRAVLLTGQSAYRHSQLSPPQRALLAPLADLGFDVVQAGFPYHHDQLARPWRREPLLSASARNGAQFLAALGSDRFRGQLSRHLRPLLEHTERALLVVAGSSGLQLWAAAQPPLHPPPGLRVRIVALGPVLTPGTYARVAATGVDVDIVRGERDWISRLGHRGVVDAVTSGGHLDYPDSPEVHKVVRAAALALLARTGEPRR